MNDKKEPEPVKTASKTVKTVKKTKTNTVKTKTNTEIVVDIILDIEGAEGETVTKKMIKKSLKERGISMTNFELNNIIKEINE